MENPHYYNGALTRQFRYHITNEANTIIAEFDSLEVCRSWIANSVYATAEVDVVLTKQQKAEPALRYDQGKTPYHLFPLDAYEEICRVMQFGAQKYAERNWEKGMSWSRVARSMLSHFIQMCKGETHDAESGCTHAGHMAWNALVLCAYTLRPHLHKMNDLSQLYHGVKDAD